MQISIMEISMSLNGNLGLSWGIMQPTEKIIRLYLASTNIWILKIKLIWKLSYLGFFQIFVSDTSNMPNIPIQPKI